MIVPAVVSIAPVSPVTLRLIFPPVPASEKEFRLPVVMLPPPTVERAIDPPFPNKVEAFRLALSASMLISLVLVRLIFRP